jgi:hypothetical protein
MNNVFELMPVLDFSIFMDISPNTYILMVTALIFIVSAGTEAIVFIFIKLLEYCETAFNGLDMGKPFYKKVKKDRN